MNDFKAKIIAELDTSQVEKKINELDGKKVKFGVDSGNTQKGVEKVDTSIKSATKSTKTFGDTLKASAKLGTAYSITSQAFQAIREAASKAKEAVQEFDAAVMDLRMATGGTYTEVSNLVKGYNELGKSIGATTKEVSSGADSWLRQGHSISDTNTLIRDSMILSKVANLESANATQLLTASMKGYGVAVEDVIGIVDKLTAVDLVSATDAGGLAEAMSRTAESADIAGVSMDKLIGYLAVTGEVTQKSMSSIGEGFKTIFTRMGDIKSGKLEFVDEDGTTESLSDVETVLNNLGIKLRESDNEFRNFGDVLDEVGAAWNSYSTVQKAAISKAFAGTRQSENFKVLMENYSKATSYMETSTNSAGTAEQKFEAYLDSLEAKTKSLQASFESLAINTFSTESFGGIIDATSSIVTFLDKTNLLKGTLVGLTAAGAIKGFTMLATGITNASIRLNEFNAALKLVKAGNIGENEVQMLAKMTANLSQSQLKAVLSSKALSNEQRITILTTQGLTKTEAEAALASMGLATAEGAATASTFTLSGALKGLWNTLMANPMILVATAVSGVVAVFTGMAQAAKEAEEESKELYNSLQEQAKASKETSDSLKSLISEYKELADAYDGSWNSTELSQLETIQSNITDLVGEQAKNLDLVNGKIDEEYQRLLGIYRMTSQESYDAAESAYLAAEQKFNKGYDSGYSNTSGKVVDGSASFYLQKAAEQIYGYDDGSKWWAEQVFGDYGGKGWAGQVPTALDEIESYEEGLEKLKQWRKLLADAENQDGGFGYWGTDFLGNEKWIEYDTSDALGYLDARIKEFEEAIQGYEDAKINFFDEKANKEVLDYLTTTDIDTQQQFTEWANKVWNDDSISKDYAESLITTMSEFLPKFKIPADVKRGLIKDRDELLGELTSKVPNSSKEMFGDWIDDLTDAEYQSFVDWWNANSDNGFSDYQTVFDAFTKYLKLNRKEFEQNTGEVIDVDLDSTIDSLKSAYDLIETAKEEMANGGGLSTETIKALADESEEYLNYLYEENGVIKLNTEAWQAYSAARAQADISTVKNNIESLEAERELILDNIYDGNDTDENRTRLDDINNQIRDNQQKLSIYQAIFDSIVNSVNGATEAATEFTDVIDSINSSNDILEAAEEEMANGGGLSDDTIKSLQGITDDYIDYLYVENGLIKLNVEAWKERAELEKQNNITAIENDIAKLEEEGDVIRENLAYWEDRAYQEGAGASEIDNVNKYTAELEANTAAIDENRHKLEILLARYNSATEAVNQLVKALSDVQGLSSGFDQLDEIYADVYNKEDFDWSSILNNKDFIEEFGNLGDVYTDFIKVVSNTPDDIEACQSAFDKLATAYLLNSDTLAGVTDETRNATILMLKQMGIANAATIVDQRLAYNKERLKFSTGEYADATYDEIYALYKECEAGTVTRQVLAELAAEKFLLNDNGIKTSSDIDQLIALANSANATTASLERLTKAKELIAKAEEAEEKAKSSKNPFIRTIENGKKLFYNAQAQAILNQGLDYEEIDPSEFKVDYVGGDKTNSEKDSSDSSNEDKIEAFDWIEIAITRVEEAIDRLKIAATSTYKSLKVKLGAAVDEIGLVNKEIALQQQAYTKYMEKANSVSLPSSLKQKVRDGSIDINDYDSDTRDQIEEYQEWLEKAYEASDAIAQLHEDIAALYEDNFNNIKDEFDNQLDLAAHLTAEYETGIDMLEARGYLESTKYYSALQDSTKGNIAILNKELSELEKSFADAMDSGEIEVESEAWYSMKLAINDVKEEIADANVELAEYAKTMREIEWGYFDYNQERISQLTQEANFLIDLLSNSDLHTDKGQLTDDGMATMGLHGQNYNVYMAQADAYAEELLNINKELANDPYNTELIERREELLGLQQDSILAAEDEKQAIVSLVEEGIAFELESLQELIDAYTESLDSAKDLYEYEKKISEQTANIASIQKQLSAYENDLSEETRAKVQKLTVELSDAEQELQETEYEQYITDQKKLLTDLKEEYELVLNQRLDNVDALIGDMITAVNDNTGSINETLTTAADNVGYEMTANMQNIWNGATDALDGTISKYGDDFGTKLTAVQAVLDSIQANTAAMVNQSDDMADETTDEAKPTTPVTPTSPPSSTANPTTATPTTPSTSEKAITVGGKINAKGAKIYDYAGDKSGENQYFANDPIYKVLDEKNGYLKVRHHKLSSGITGWFKKSDVKAYKSGGLVDYTGLAKVDGTPEKPELMLNAEDTENFLGLRDLLRALSSQSLDAGNSYGFGAPTLSGVTDVSRILSTLRSANGGNMGTTVGDIEINIPIERVDDYNDFVNKLKNDKKFENMMLDATVGRLAGGSSLAKHKYKW